MDAPIRALSIYLVLLILFRVSGRRTLSELSSFDFVLLLIIGESTQQALLGNDFSITNAALVITTLIGIDILLAWIKQRSRFADRWLEGVPMIILENGTPLHDRLRKARVDESDILHAAREKCGLAALDSIRYAVLERNGGITIIPRHIER